MLRYSSARCAHHVNVSDMWNMSRAKILILWLQVIHKEMTFFGTEVCNGFVIFHLPFLIHPHSEFLLPKIAKTSGGNQNKLFGIKPRHTLAAQKLEWQADSEYLTMHLTDSDSNTNEAETIKTY